MIGPIILTLIFLLSVWIVRYFYREARARRLARSSRRRLPFRCVTINYDESLACAAVRQLPSTRYLCRLAPIVPLPHCDRTYCQCWYEHFDDRRHMDRRDYYSRTSREFGGAEKRIRNGDRRRHFDPALREKPVYVTAGMPR